MSHKVIIVGAGPVGLLLANLLGSKNIETLVLEKELTRNPWSKAIGITPPSLGILDDLKLAQTFIKKGVIGRKAVFYGNSLRLGALTIKKIASKFPFLLSLSQARTEKILENNLKKYRSVTLLRGYKVFNIKSNSQGYLIDCFNSQELKNYTFSSEFICACDGEKSIVRKLVNIPFRGYFFEPTFIMGDYYDKTHFGKAAVLWFTNKGSIESFPLPNKSRRWIIQTSKFIVAPEEGFLEAVILKRSGVSLNVKDKVSQNSFSVQKLLADSYGEDKVFLCGDSAHTMPPIGGQGMNTGFADAEFLAYIISTYLKNPKLDLEILANKYEFYRKNAAKSATLRANIGMRIGTAKNSLISLIRSFILTILLHLPISRIVVPLFTMMNIPYNRLYKVLKKENIIWSASNQV
ncbi:MAG: NAD(P)/FAD-dependent oxidoreductase [Candidatus Lokiarchaeota archaeon]|jgi:2-polyprenyl-6-methoxyphenol hydroxylase-like FAD-dependent oxidoreductase